MKNPEITFKSKSITKLEFVFVRKTNTRQKQYVIGDHASLFNGGRWTMMVQDGEQD